MPEKITVETEETPPPPPPPNDRLLDLALEVGQMRAERESATRELIEVRSQLAQACDLIRSNVEMTQSLQSQTRNAQTQAEVAVAMAAATAEELEDQEGDQEVLPVTPEVETHIQIDQTPVKNRRGMLTRMIFGNGQ